MARRWVVLGCVAIACGPNVPTQTESTTESSTSSDPMTTATTSLDGSTTSTTALDGSSSSAGTTTSGDPPDDGLGPWGYWPHATDISAAEVVVADFDGDGHVDIFTQTELDNGQGTLGVNRGDGALGFALPISTTIAWGLLPAAGDFDGMAGLDLVAFPPSSTDNLLIALANDDGLFGISFESAADSYFADFGFAVLDVDDDGLDDVMMPNGHSEGASIYTSDGNGNVIYASTIMQPACYFAGSAVGDFDGDGFDDVAAKGSCNSIPELLPLVVYQGTGAGLVVGQTIAEGPMVLESGNLVATDLDDDGDLDLVTGTEGAETGLTVLVNDGGTFATPELRTFAWNDQARRITPARLDADAPIAFVVQHDLATAVIEQADETQWPSTEIELGGEVVGAADFDEDGRTDVVVLVEGELTIWASAG